MEAIDLSCPDMHFYHGSMYETSHDNWVETGNKSSLVSMLKGIAYATSEPDSEYENGSWTKWVIADDWLDDETFGERKFDPDRLKRTDDRCKCGHKESRHDTQEQANTWHNGRRLCNKNNWNPFLCRCINYEYKP